MKSYYSKKLNKKGFTLIELLAVLVVLAILALITTPIVLGIINDARKSARQRSVDAYGKAIELGVAQIMIDQESAEEEQKLNPNGETTAVPSVGLIGDEYANYDSILTDFVKDYAQGDKRGEKYVTTKGSKVECDVFYIYADGSIYLSKCTADGKEVLADVNSSDDNISSENAYKDGDKYYYVYKSVANK